MIQITNTQVMGWEPAIRGMRNPLNSWDHSDSGMLGSNFVLGKNDLKLMQTLAKGEDDGKFARMIVVYADINAPMYWWKEYDTYKVGTVANSCSTMHTIHKRDLTLEDFSYNNECEDVYKDTVRLLNSFRHLYVETNDKKYWNCMIQLLPMSFMQKRTVMLNYQVMHRMYEARWNHKLREWHRFCDWVLEAPYFRAIFGIGNDDGTAE